MRKIRVGVVVSDKMDKIVVVVVERFVQYFFYKKIIKRIIKFKVYDENNECRVGDKVLIMEIRLFFKEKRWRVV